MKKTTIILIALFLGVTIGASAQEGSDCPTSGTVPSAGSNPDEIIEWSIEGSTLTIGGSGSIPDYDYGQAPWACNFETITDIIVGEGIICVGTNAFSNFFAMRSMTLQTTDLAGLYFCSTEAANFANVPINNATLYVPFELIDLYSYMPVWMDFGEILPISCPTSGNIIRTTNNPDDIIYWEIKNGTLTIDGTGNILDYQYGRAPWACDGSEIINLIIGDGIGSIGNEAFSNFVNLQTVTVYWQDPESVPMSAPFGNINVGNVTLYVPAGTVDIYKMTPDWRAFKIVESMEQNVEITEVTDNSVEISWDEVSGAAMYLVSVFDDRENINPVYYEEVSANSSKAAKTYTVLIEELMPAQTYFYNIEAIDSDNNAIAGISGNFTTTGTSTIGKTDANAITVYTTAAGVTVINAIAGETITVYTLSGMIAATARTNEGETNIALSARGIYIVKVGGFTTKVVVSNY